MGIRDLVVLDRQAERLEIESAHDDCLDTIVNGRMYNGHQSLAMYQRMISVKRGPQLT